MSDSESKQDQKETDAQVPALHGAGSIVLATFFGGPFAAAYLVRSNFLRLRSQSNWRRHLLVLALLGVANLYLAVTTPSDVLSQFIAVVLPTLLLVGAYIFYLNRFVLKGQQRRARSLWYGAAAGIIARLAIQGAVTWVLHLQEVWNVGYSHWLNK